MELKIGLTTSLDEKAILHPPTQAEKPISGGCDSYRGLVTKYFPANQVDNALLTMRLESGCNPRAVSLTNDHGLFQINNGLANHGTVIYDPEFNTKLAYEHYFSTRGWTPWYAVRGILW